jgi:hypothetical protein
LSVSSQILPHIGFGWCLVHFIPSSGEGNVAQGGNQGEFSDRPDPWAASASNSAFKDALAVMARV